MAINTRLVKGFTLIEVLIVIAIIGALVLVAAPLTGGWVKEANITNVESAMNEAIGRAKAIALRNENAITGNNAVAAICIDSATRKLTVLESASAGASPDCTTPTGAQVWQSQLSTDIAVTVAGASVTCLCFDNKSILTQASNCSTCTNATNFNLNSGGGIDPVSVSIF